MRLPCAKTVRAVPNRLLSSKIKFAQVDLRKDWFEAALRRALLSTDARWLEASSTVFG